MNPNPHCTEEQTEVQRGGKILPKLHRQVFGKNRLSSLFLAPNPALGVPPQIHSFSLSEGSPGGGSLWGGGVPGTGLHVATGKQGDSDMPSSAQSLSFPTCPEDILPPSPLRLEPMDPEGPFPTPPHLGSS